MEGVIRSKRYVDFGQSWWWYRKLKEVTLFSLAILVGVFSVIILPPVWEHYTTPRAFASERDPYLNSYLDQLAASKTASAAAEPAPKVRKTVLAEPTPELAELPTAEILLGPERSVTVSDSAQESEVTPVAPATPEVSRPAVEKTAEPAVVADLAPAKVEPKPASEPKEAQAVRAPVVTPPPVEKTAEVVNRTPVWAPVTFNFNVTLPSPAPKPTVFTAAPVGKTTVEPAPAPQPATILVAAAPAKETVTKTTAESAPSPRLALADLTPGESVLLAADLEPEKTTNSTAPASQSTPAALPAKPVKTAPVEETVAEPAPKLAAPVKPDPQTVPASKAETPEPTLVSRPLSSLKYFNLDDPGVEQVIQKGLLSRAELAAEQEAMHQKAKEQAAPPPAEPKAEPAPTPEPVGPYTSLNYFSTDDPLVEKIRQQGLLPRPTKKSAPASAPTSDQPTARDETKQETPPAKPQTAKNSLAEIPLISELLKEMEQEKKK